MVGKAKAKSRGKDKAKSSVQPASGSTATSKWNRKKNAAKEEPWLDDLGHALAKAGLRIRTVQADGNCFFRSCCDQMQGNEIGHMLLRTEVIDFIRDHPDDFAPYMEDEEDFTSYCKRMSKVAITRLKGIVLCIHQAGQPCWTIRPDFPEIPKDAHAWHLSYHDGEHYNSVRLANDYGDEAAMPISISPNGTVTPESVSTSGSRWGQQKMAAVRWGTGCEDETKLTEALDKAKGDPAKAIEDLVEQMASVASPSCQKGNSIQEESTAEACATEDIKEAEPDDTTASSTLLLDSKGDAAEAKANEVEERDKRQGWKLVTPLKDRLPARSRACVCGSGKKYKNCCGIHKGAAARRRKAEETRATDAKPGIAVSMSNLFI